MDYRPKILELAQTQPLLPNHVAKALETNSIMAGAMLSEMCSKGLLKTSNLRVGGSPLYYKPGNETQLLNHLSSLNEKDRRTVQKLQQEKIIRENETDPLTRVSLTQIKDFAKPLTVTYQNNNETFWKWFEISDKDAEQHIAQKLNPQPEKKIEIPKQEIKPELPKTQTKQEQTIPAPKPTTETPQTTLEPKPETLPAGEFWDKINNFLTTNNIKLLEQTTIKKKTEYDLLIEIPSPVGTLTYYCKARSKKKISDADISAAYVTGQIKKLPVIYITDGELNKQAKTILTQIKGITIKSI